MITSKYIFSILSLLLCIGHLNAQEEFQLTNPSFENPSMDENNPGKPYCCKAPRGWIAYGGANNILENSPDPQPGNFLVTLPAASGNYYVGMVTRDVESHESISQRFRIPLEGGKCYTFSIKAYFSKDLESISRRTDETVKYDKPIKLRFWGGDLPGHRAELLAETAPIKNTYWKQYNFKFEPIRGHDYFTIEAFYVTPVPFPYNGNVMIDDASAIVVVPCDEERAPDVVDVEPPEQPINVSPSRPKNEPKVDPQPSDPVVSAPPVKNDPPEEYQADKILKLDRKNLVEGQIIRIENLYFKADSTNISDDAFPVLNEIYAFLKSNSDISIEVGGHTNNRCETVFCDDLSEQRAKAVADYLIEKGIRSRRLLFKGYGKRNPVATNATPTGRKRNQRVEIKILNLDG